MTFSFCFLKIADGNSSYIKTTEHERIRLIHSAWEGAHGRVYKGPRAGHCRQQKLLSQTHGEKASHYSSAIGVANMSFAFLRGKYVTYFSFCFAKL